MATLVQNDGLKTASWRQPRACLPSYRKCCDVDVTLINKHQVKCWFCLKAYFFEHNQMYIPVVFLRQQQYIFIEITPWHWVCFKYYMFTLYSQPCQLIVVVNTCSAYCSGGVSFCYFGLLVTIVIARMPQSMSLHVNCAISKSSVRSWSLIDTIFTKVNPHRPNSFTF